MACLGLGLLQQGRPGHWSSYICPSYIWNVLSRSISGIIVILSITDFSCYLHSLLKAVMCNQAKTIQTKIMNLFVSHGFARSLYILKPSLSTLAKKVCCKRIRYLRWLKALDGFTMQNFTVWRNHGFYA